MLCYLCSHPICFSQPCGPPLLIAEPLARIWWPFRYLSHSPLLCWHILRDFVLLLLIYALICVFFLQHTVSFSTAAHGQRVLTTKPRFYAVVIGTCNYMRMPLLPRAVLEVQKLLFSFHVRSLFSVIVTYLIVCSDAGRGGGPFRAHRTGKWRLQ